MKLHLRADVIVVGCGPVGLLASLLMSKLGINHIAVERSSTLRQHPSAHWINMRSKEILSEIHGLVEKVQNQQQDWKYFSHYRYVERILGRSLGADHHFAPSISQKLKSLQRYSKFQPSHLSQNKLVKIMQSLVPQKETIKLGVKVQSVKQNTPQKVIMVGRSGDNDVILQSKYVIACDGFHSSIRKELKIELEGQQKLLSFINIHFTSKQLGRLISLQNQDAMLHFIYNHDFPSVLVNHSKRQGVFVLQIPNYEPFYDILKHFSPQELIHKIIQPGYQIQDIQVIHAGRWILSSQVAEKYSKGNIFLAGDAAHSFPPAGGFGMNTGFQDVHNLIHKLNILKNNPNVEKEQFLLNYHKQRKEVCKKVMVIANNGYGQSLQIAKTLGLNPKYLDYTKYLAGLSVNKHLYSLGMKLLFKPKTVDTHIKLFFQQQFTVQRLSKYRHLFSSLPSTTSYICDKSSPTFPQIQSIEPRNIHFCDLEGEKLIRSDGILLH